MKSPFRNHSGQVVKTTVILFGLLTVSTATVFAAVDQGIRTGELEKLYEEKIIQPAVIVTEMMNTRLEQQAREMAERAQYREAPKVNTIRVINRTTVRTETKTFTDNNEAEQGAQYQVQQSQQSHPTPFPTIDIEKIREENRQWVESKSAESKADLETFRAESDQNMAEFDQQAQADMEAFKAESAAKIEAFKEEYGL